MKKSFNLTSLSRTYGESYVARIMGTNQIIAHAKNADEVMDKIKDTEEFKKKKIVISWIPKYGARYVFGISFLLCRG